MKKILSSLLVIGLIMVVVGYAFYNDPERHEHRLFQDSLQKIASIIRTVERDYPVTTTLSLDSQQLAVGYVSRKNVTANIQIFINSENNILVVRFGEGDTALAQKTILLEPKIHAQQVIWKCLGGSVLLRFRSKACRLGEYINFNSQLSPNEK